MLYWIKIFKRIKNTPSILKILIPVLAGIVFAFQTNFNLTRGSLFLIVILLFSLVVLTIFNKLLVFRSKMCFGVLVSLLFFFVSILSVEASNSLNRDNYFFQKGVHYYQVRINEPPEIKNKTVKVLIDFISRNDSVVCGKSMAYIERNERSESLGYGDILLINSKFNETRTNGNPFEFNYSNYLKLFDIHHQSYLNSSKWLKIGNSQNILFRITYEISGYLSSVIDSSSLNIENKAIAKALLLGQKDDLGKDVLRTYSSAGAMHVLAVSGLHVGIIMMILMFVLKPLKRFKKGSLLFLFAVLFGVWFYAFVTGLSPSVLRSSLMFSFIVIGNELERETSVYQSIMVSALLLLLIDPLVLFKVGFQLSYLAVLGIVYLQPRIYQLIYIKNKYVDYLWQVSSVSIAAQIATFPLGLYYFHQFPNFFLVSNLIVIPLAGIILVVGIIYLTFNEVPYLNEFVLSELNGVLSFMNSTVEWVESLPYSITWGISILWYEVVLIYIALILMVFSFTRKNNKFLLGSLFVSVIGLSMLMYKSHVIENSNELIIYNIKDELAIDVFSGDKNFFLSSDSLLKNEDKMLFNIRHYWFHKMGIENPIEWQDISKLDTSVFQLGSKTFSVRNKNSELYLTDFIIISDEDYLSNYVLKKWELNNCMLIIHPKAKYQVKKIILSSYPDELIYDMKSKGAFIFAF
jgi:competence protein ComEC